MSTEISLEVTISKTSQDSRPMKAGEELKELAKYRIKESIRLKDQLLDQAELAEALNIEIALVDRAYKELVEEGAVHRETFYLWKDPVMRKDLLEARQSEEGIPFEVVREKLGI